MDLITVSRVPGAGVDVRVRGHSVRASLGGGADGFTPAELLAGSLGACIALIVQDRCDRRGQAGEVGVNLTLELADDPKRVAAIFAEVEIPPGVPEDEKERILRLAGKCVIHETLSRPPRVDMDVA